MSAETIPMSLDLPVDAPAEKKKRPRMPSQNRLQEIFIKLVNSKKVQLADVQDATGIPWSTLMGWYRGAAKVQVADKNLLKLAQYFNVSLEYLCFGIGDEAEFYKTFEK